MTDPSALRAILIAMSACGFAACGILYNIQNSKAPSGTSESAALRRLRKDRPDLHARVLNGELRAHAAMVEAGFRPKTFTVRADDLASIVGTLRHQLDPEVFAQVVELARALIK